MNIKNNLMFTAVASAVVFSQSVVSANAQESGLQLEEVIVTAQKRAESIQNVPIAMSAFDSDELRKLGTVSMENVAKVTPGLYFTENQSIKSSGTSIRGITPVSGSAGADPSVGYYIDEVYLGANVSSVVDLYEAERIEVLRGPQGTLYGRNTIGGVVSITSKRPTEDFEAKLTAQLGNYSSQRYGASVSGPLIDGKLSGLISGLYYEREGYEYNAFLQDDTNDRKQWGIRASLLFTPSDQWEILVNFDSREVDQKAQSFETLLNNDFSLLGSIGQLVNRDPEDRRVFGNFPGKETLEDAWGLSMKAVYSTDTYEAVSVTGFRTHTYLVDGESDLIPFGVGRNSDPEESDLFTQEFRVASTTDSDLQWMVGVYYSDLEAIADGKILIENDLLTLFGAGFLGEVGGGSTGFVDAQTYAIFGSFDYRLSDQFEVTLGMRQTWEEKDFNWFQNDLEALFGAPILGGTGTAAGSDEWSEFTPALTLRYHVNDDVMIFATASRGFKSGGYNVDSGVPSQQSEGFDPEFMDNFELGLKSTWLDQRVLVNASVYTMIWEDIQIRADDPTTPASFDPRIDNAGEARSSGFELEVKALVSERLSVDFMANLMDAEFKEGVLPTGIGEGIPLDEFAKVPDYTVSANVEYTVPVSDGLELTLRGEFRRQGDMLLDKRPLELFPYIPVREQPAYNLWNARLTLAADNWDVALWGYNLADETYLTNTFDLYNNPFVSQYFGTLGAPRTYGVELQYRF